MEPGLESYMMAKIKAITLAANPRTKDTLEVMTWPRLVKATQEDAVMVKLSETIERGFPDSKHNVPQDLQEYHRYRHCLHTINGVNCYKGRLVESSYPANYGQLH